MLEPVRATIASPGTVPERLSTPLSPLFSSGDTGSSFTVFLNVESPDVVKPINILFNMDDKSKSFTTGSDREPCTRSYKTWSIRRLNDATEQPSSFTIA